MKRRNGPYQTLGTLHRARITHEKTRFTHEKTRPVAAVDYVALESVLQHRNAQRGRINRVYVQVHNRGFAPGANVTVKLLYANASAGLPPLPADFWTAFPNNTAVTTTWTPIGTAKVIASLSPSEPTILEWDWNTPATAADHTYLLVVMDSPSNPIPAGNKVFDLGSLVPNEKRVGLKNLHVVNAVPGTTFGGLLGFYSRFGKLATIRVLPSALGGWSLGVILPKSVKIAKPTEDQKPQVGWAVKKPTATMLRALKAQLGAELAGYEGGVHYVLENGEKGGTLPGVAIPKGGFRALLTMTPPATIKGTATFTIVQEEEGRVVGGNTYVLRAATRR